MIPSHPPKQQELPFHRSDSVVKRRASRDSLPLSWDGRGCIGIVHALAHRASEARPPESAGTADRFYCSWPTEDILIRSNGDKFLFCAFLLMFHHPLLSLTNENSWAEAHPRTSNEQYYRSSDRHELAVAARHDLHLESLIGIISQRCSVPPVSAHLRMFPFEPMETHPPPFLPGCDRSSSPSDAE